MTCGKEVQVYGAGFAEGFTRFRNDRDFADVIVVINNDEEFYLHGLLLAHQSEFFHKAMTADFQEKMTRRIQLQLDETAAQWPLLLDYFYTNYIAISEENVMPLMALSRQLLVAAVDAFCLDFVQKRLTVNNCMAYLAKTVNYGLIELQQVCVDLAAKGFFFLFDEDTSNLPSKVLLEILQHAELQVHCEEQVLKFVLRHMEDVKVDEATQMELGKQIRLCYLSNATLARLAGRSSLDDMALDQASSPKDDVQKKASSSEPSVTYAEYPLHIPRQLVLEAAVDRLALKAGLKVAVEPRPTYCCSPSDGLPGGSTFMEVELEQIWDTLSPHIRVAVSGVSEGSPLNVVSSDPEAWFETNDSSEPHPWIAIYLPSHVKVIHFRKYAFSHGHKRVGYFRARNFRTQISETGCGSENWKEIGTRIEQSEVYVMGQQNVTRPWSSMRIVAIAPQEDGVHRLCMRNIRISGRARIDLMQQRGAFVLDKTFIKNTLAGPTAETPPSPDPYEDVFHTHLLRTPHGGFDQSGPITIMRRPFKMPD